MFDMDEVTYEDFARLELRVGEIKSAEEVESSEKLLKLVVSFGSEERQVVSGIKKFYSPEEILGKKFVFITNLAPRNIMGLESQAMILAAEDEDGRIVVLQPEKDIAVGSGVR